MLIGYGCILGCSCVVVGVIAAAAIIFVVVAAAAVAAVNVVVVVVEGVGAIVFRRPVGVIAIGPVIAATRTTPPATHGSRAFAAARRYQKKQEERQEPLSPGPSRDRRREQSTNGLNDPVEAFGGGHHLENGTIKTRFDRMIEWFLLGLLVLPAVSIRMGRVTALIVGWTRARSFDRCCEICSKVRPIPYSEFRKGGK